MELKDIQKSITDMTDDELRALLTGIRSSRRVAKRPHTAKAISSSKPKPEVSLSALIDGISASEAAALLKRLGG